MKYFLAALSSFLLNITACQATPIIVSPDMKGKLFSSKTNTPITTEAKIIKRNKVCQTTSNQQGIFFLKKCVLSLNTSNPNEVSFVRNSTNFSIIAEGYHHKIYEYGNFLSKNKISFTSNDTVINLGKVYLTPLDMPNPDKE